MQRRFPWRVALSLYAHDRAARQPRRRPRRPTPWEWPTNLKTVLIGGDICPIGCNTELFRRGDAVGLFHDLLEDFSAADLVVANLECPLIERPTPIPKIGPTFGEDSACL